MLDAHISQRRIKDMSFKEQAERAKQSAENQTMSEYPRYGKAVYNQLAETCKDAAQVIDDNPIDDAPANTYEERKARRIAGMKVKAAKLSVEGAEASARSYEIGKHRPLGQPILVGHHSERGARATLRRQDGADRKARDLSVKADEMERRAGAAEDNTAISSDDPQASEKLTHKIETAERVQAEWKQINKYVKRKKGGPDKEGLRGMGLSDETILRLCSVEGWPGPGIPRFQLTNNNANIRRMKQRLERLAIMATRVNREKVYGDIRIVENADENRLQIFFPGKPAYKVRTELKRYGFRWAPKWAGQPWQRQLTNTALHYAETIVKEQAP